MRKLPVWLLALALTAVGAAGALGYGYKKAQSTGINGTINITTSQAIGVDSISFGAWAETDDSALGLVSEDGMSYKIGLQLNNGDYYGGPGQEIWITLYSYAKKPMIVQLKTGFSVSNPDPSDLPMDDIHIWYGSDGTSNSIGQADPWSYLVRIPAMGAGSAPATQRFCMFVDIGNTVSPGFYSFETFIEPTNWGGLSSVNM